MGLGWLIRDLCCEGEAHARSALSVTLWPRLSVITEMRYFIFFEKKPVRHQRPVIGTEWLGPVQGVRTCAPCKLYTVKQKRAWGTNRERSNTWREEPGVVCVPQTLGGNTMRITGYRKFPTREFLKW